MKSFGEYLESKYYNKIPCQCDCTPCKNKRCDLCNCKECKEGKKCAGCDCDKKYVYKNKKPDPLKNSAKAKLPSKHSEEEDENKSKVRIIGDLETTRRFR